MIAIKVDGQYLDLPDNTKFRLKLPSQVFSRNFVSQGYSYPIKLPKTSRNQRAMRYYERLANTREYEDIPCTIELGNNTWRAAIIKFRGMVRGAYDIDVQIPDRDEVLALRTKTTQDVTVTYPIKPAGDFDLDDVQDALDQFVGSATETDLIIAPIHNTGIFGDRDETYFNVDLAAYPEFAPPDQYLNWYDPDRTQPWLRYSLTTTPDRYIIDFVPLPYLVRVMEHLLGLADLSLGGDVFRNREVRSMVVLPNLLFYVGVGTDLSSAFPFMDFGSSVTPTVALRHMLPETTVIDLLVRVCKRFNAVPMFRRSRLLEIRSRNDILNSAYYEDITHWVEPQEQFDLEPTQGVTYQELVEGLDNLRKEVKYDPSRITQTIRLPEELDDIVGPQNGDLVYCEVNNMVYLFQFNNWEQLTDLTPAVSVNSGGEQDDVGVGFTRMYHGSDPHKSGRKWLVPHVEQILYDPYLDIHKLGLNRPDQLRLLFYRGFQRDSQDKLYPLLSNDVYRYDGSEIYGVEMREALDGPRGIIQRWYTSWERAMRNARVITRRIRIPPHRLRNFEFDRKYRIDGQVYLVREIDVEFTTSSMGVANVELVRLPTEITGVRRPISCAGRGHFTLVTQNVLSDGETLFPTFINFIGTDSFALGYRQEDGLITITETGDIDQFNTEPQVMCIFPADENGDPLGDISFLEINAYVKEVIIRYLNNLTQFSLPSGAAATLEVPMDLTRNTQLERLRLDGYPFSTIDISRQSNLTELVMPDSALTSIDVSNNPNLYQIDLSGCALDDVDQLFLDINPVDWQSGQYIDVSGGTNAAPTSASAAARATLAGLNWTITTN